MKWSRETPTKDGWYWIKYREGRGMRKIPCHVTCFKNKGMTANIVKTARGLSLMEGPNHGGWGLKYIDHTDKVKKLKCWFSPEIPEP